MSHSEIIDANAEESLQAIAEALEQTAEEIRRRGMRGRKFSELHRPVFAVVSAAGHLVPVVFPEACVVVSSKSSP